MKKNKLYTANKWNRPAFMPEERNLFLTGGPTYNPVIHVPTPTLSTPTLPSPPIDWSNSASVTAATSNILDNFSKNANMIVSDTFNNTGAGAGGAAGAAGAGAAGVMPYLSAGLGLLQGIGTYVNNSQILDTEGYTDYYKDFGNQTYSGDFNSILNQRRSSWLPKSPSWREIRGMSSGDKFTSAISSGVSGAMAGAGFGLPGALIGAGVGALFSLFGSKRGDNKAKERANELQMEREAALAENTEAYRTGIINANNDANRRAMMNLSAYGGSIETGDMRTIDYGFMSNYLTQKRKENDVKSKMNGIVPMPAFMSNSYAIGGDLQTNRADYSVGKIYNVSEKEANRLKAMGYEFTVVG